MPALLRPLLREAARALATSPNPHDRALAARIAAAVGAALPPSLTPAARYTRATLIGALERVRPSGAGLWSLKKPDLVKLVMAELTRPEGSTERVAMELALRLALAESNRFAMPNQKAPE
jgi:hypothetical protein